MKHVNLYTYSSAKSTKAAKMLGTAVGYILEFPTEKGAATLTATIPLYRLHKENDEITTNHAWLLVTLAALSRINARAEIDLFTECRFLANVLSNGWLEQWEGNGWHTSSGKPVQYAEDWKRLAVLMRPHEVRVRLCLEYPYKEWLKHEVEVEHEFMKKEDKVCLKNLESSDQRKS